MSDNVDVPCEMCGRYGCDPKHHEPMTKQCSCGAPLPCRVSQLTVSDLRNAHCARGGIVDPPSSPASATEPAGGTGERRRALLARQERYSEAVYGDGRGVTPRVSDIMAIADDEIRAATKSRDGLHERAGAEMLAMDATIERRTDVLASLDGTIADQEGTISLLRTLLSGTRGTIDRLTAEAEDSRAAYIALVAEQSAKVNERDATIERLQGQVERMTYERSHPFGDRVENAIDTQDSDELECEIWALKSGLSMSDGLRKRLAVDAVKDGLLIADLQTALADANATIERLTDAVFARDNAYHRPHSRACGIRKHEHGTECHSNCPTCGGRPLNINAAFNRRAW